jgi:hypothetical protein
VTSCRARRAWRARGGERDERRDRVRRGRHDEDLERQDEPESDEEVGEAVLLALGRLVDALLDDVDARVLHVLAGLGDALDEEVELHVVGPRHLGDAFFHKDPEEANLVGLGPSRVGPAGQARVDGGQLADDRLDSSRGLVLQLVHLAAPDRHVRRSRRCVTGHMLSVRGVRCLVVCLAGGLRGLASDVGDRDARRLLGGIHLVAVLEHSAGDATDDAARWDVATDDRMRRGDGAFPHPRAAQDRHLGADPAVRTDPDRGP